MPQEDLTEEASERRGGCTDKPKQKITLIQQTFHRSMFVKTRSNSVGVIHSFTNIRTDSRRYSYSRKLKELAKGSIAIH